MQTLKNLLLVLLTAGLPLIFMSAGCGKNVPDKQTDVKPVIKSFVVVSATMTTTTFNFSAENYSQLAISIDGGAPVAVSGGSYTATGLSSNKSYSAVLIATGHGKEVKSSQSFTTAKSALTVSDFKAGSITSSGATFTFSASSNNSSIISQKLVNDSTGESFDVTGLSALTVANLAPSTVWKFTFTVKDNTGNEVERKLQFLTLDKTSEWFSISSVTYGEQFAIIGNALGSKLTIKLHNSSGSEKVLKHLAASFGQNGHAVKMLRYSLNAGSWVRLIQVDKTIVFTNLRLAPGENVIEAYFALKPDVGGVANNSPLTFKVFDLNDNEGAKLPANGAYPEAVSVGTVNAVTQPTVIMSNVLGYMYSPAAVPPTTTGFISIYQVIALKVAGPAGARLTSIRLRNPYASVFPGMIFGYQGFWGAQYRPNAGIEVKNFFWQNDFINLTLSDEINLLKTNGENNDYSYYCNSTNTSQEVFYTGYYTPQKSGFILTSKYDVVIKNASGQVVDLSETVVRHEDVILQN